MTNSVLCNNNGTLTISPAGTLTNTVTGVLNNYNTLINNSTLTNDGLIANSGLIVSAGTLHGSGTLNNAGIMVVTSGNVSIANSGNLSGGTLTGGSWVVDGSGNNKSKTSLTIGSGAITTNNANVELIGFAASFSQLTNLATNNGSLRISDGAGFTSAALHNTGTLTAARGGTVDIKSSGNLSNGTLTGGIWMVDNAAGISKLTVGGGAITTNDADIVLSGAGAMSSFSQLSGLANNSGSLTVAGGADLGSKMSLYNTGTLTVGAGSSVELQGSKNLSNGTLTGGTWIVAGSGSTGASLVIGKNDITTNNANIALIGANADFGQISALANNQGTLTIGEGASYATSAALNNTGTIVTLAGGTLNLTNSKPLPLTNDGFIKNGGNLVVATKISGKGTLDNAGTLTVLSGANVQIANSGNFSNGTLTGGTWIVDGSGGSKTATLAIGSGNITTNNANIELIGANASFGQLAGLEKNNGRLAITGTNFTSAYLTNTGTVAVTSGTMTIAKSGNLSAGTLTGGSWVVDGSADSKSKTSLAIGSAPITTNNANIELIGFAASFSQITNLANNGGSLAARDGAEFTSTALYNTGTLTAASGGTINIAKSGNLSNGTLTGGTWVVDNNGGTSELTVGSGAITTNNANIQLLGANAVSSFAQMGGLANNAGSITVGAGASLGSKMSLHNTGTLTVTSGGTVSLDKSGNLSGGTLTGGTWVVDASGGTGASLAIGTNAITTNNANIKLIGANADFSQISALANNQGTLTIGAGANYATSAALNNTGTIVTQAGGTLSLENNKQKLTLTNKGSITSAGTINGNGTGNFTNAGALTIESKGAVSGFNNFVQDSGVTTLKDGATLSAKNVQFLGGVLTGSGTVDPPSPIVIGSSATVAPTGVLTLEGNTEFDGLLAIGIFGASDYGILNVLGSIDFGAGAQIDFGFDPNFNLTDSSYIFKFLFADDIQGVENLTFDFTGLDPLYTSELDLECQSGRCDYSLLLTRHDDPGGVPEPGTLLLATLGLLGFAFGRRKGPSRRV